MPKSLRGGLLAVGLLEAAILSGCAQRTINLVNITEQGLHSQWVWPNFLDEKPTVLAFWNTNEMQCLRDVPSLKTLDARGGSVELVTVVTGRDNLEVRTWIQREKIRYVVLLDLQEELANALGVSAYPTYILFDTDGKEVDRRDDIRLVAKWFDRERWLEKSGAVPATKDATPP